MEEYINKIEEHTGNLYPPRHASDIYLKNGSIFTVVNAGYTIADMIAREEKLRREKLKQLDLQLTI